MSNLSKLTIRKTTVAVLTLLLVIAIAAPLASFASAAGATATLGTTSGPNGTVISLTGTGFGASETAAQITVSVDGHAGQNVITTSLAPSAGVNPSTTISAGPPNSQIRTDATGALKGDIIIYGLALGAHTISISDATSSTIAGTFTVTAPSVTVTPSTVVAGGSVQVQSSGFPSTPFGTNYYSNSIWHAGFSSATNNNIAVTTGKATASPTTLSNDAINAGATVTLPAVGAAGPVFALVDQWGNIAATTLSLTTPTVTLSQTSGPVGSFVTATVSGFGPTATISSVKVGNVAATATTVATTPSATVTEQGTAAFVFQIPSATVNSAAGAQTITVTDNLGNVATAVFTITPKVTLALGASTTTYIPSGTTSNLVIQASGLKASTALTITATPTIPAGWITPSGTWTIGSGSYSATTRLLSTDANGVVNVISDAGAAPAAAGQYSITISDGTNSVSTIITVTTTGNIIAVSGTGASPSTGAKGSTVTITYFGATPAGFTVDGSAVTTSAINPAAAWPTPTTVTFAIQASAGLHTIGAGSNFNSVPFTVLTPSITAVTPSSASVGTTATIVGTGFSSATASLSMQGGAVAITTYPIQGDTLIGTFLVPNYLPGSYPLTLSDASNSASSTLTVAAPTIQMTGSKGSTTSTLPSSVGKTTIGFTGSGFVGSDYLSVTWDTTPLTTVPSGPSNTGTGLIQVNTAPINSRIVTNTAGGILLCSGFAIPTSAAAGTHTITVSSASGAYATATYTIQPQLGSLAAVRPGSAVTVTGNGFAANSIQALYINGTATNWYSTAASPATVINPQTLVVTGATGDLYSNAGFVVSATQEPCVLNVTVVDAAGNGASTTLTVLGTPAITLGASKIVAGNIATGVSISGTGFTPGSRAVTANLYSGTTLVTAVTTIAGTPVTVGNDGKFTYSAISGGVTFKLPPSVVAGDYTLQVTLAGPAETASAAITVMSAPTVTAPSSVVSGSNVTISVTGLSKITDASINTATVTNLVVGSAVQSSQFGAITLPTSGANAFTLTTWFIVPTGAMAGTYILTLQDSGANLQVQTAITITPTMTITPTSGIKGSTVTVTGTGFAASSAMTAKVNGQAVTLTIAAPGTSTATGGVTGTFVVPITATATNTVTVTDAAGNVATATFTLTNPTITLDQNETQVGNTVQILGSGFQAGSIVVQIAGQIVTTTPSLSATNGAFIAYFTVPAGVSGNVTVTATDSSNNVATKYVQVGTITNTSSPDATVMSNTAQSTTPSGTPTTTFTAGSTAKVGFMLQTTGAPRTVVVAVTWQQGATVYGMASFQTTMTSTASPVTFSSLLPAGATGTWTATLQVFAQDGVTPLGVTTLTFTVS